MNHVGEVAALRDAGCSAKEIAYRLRVCTATVYRALRRLGRPASVDARVKLDELLRLHGLGHTDREIARALGMTYQWAWYYRKRLGLPSNHRRKIDRS